LCKVLYLYCCLHADLQILTVVNKALNNSLA